MTDEGTPQPERPRPSRRVASLLIGAIIVFYAASVVGDLLTTTWSTSHPLALLALNARNRVVLLVTNQLDPLPYYAVGTIRLVASDPLFFLLGVFYGDTAVRWVERKSKTFGEQIRLYERAFSKAAYPLVFIAPNNFICLFAGASGMPIPSFVAVNVVGTVVRLYLLRVVGDVFSSPIDSVLSFFSQYRWPLLGVSVLLVGVTILLDQRGGKSEIGALLELEHEIEAEADAGTEATAAADDAGTPTDHEGVEDA